MLFFFIERNHKTKFFPLVSWSRKIGRIFLDFHETRELRFKLTAHEFVVSSSIKIMLFFFFFIERNHKTKFFPLVSWSRKIGRIFLDDFHETRELRFKLTAHEFVVSSSIKIMLFFFIERNHKTKFFPLVSWSRKIGRIFLDVFTKQRDFSRFLN